MSKWIKGDLFDKFQKQKIEEKETSGGFNRSVLLWQTPQKGTTETPKVYEGRFLPDPKGNFYVRYLYHMWQSGDKWYFVLCPKTHDYKTFCPFCSATSKLYNGTKDDKNQGYLIKKKERFVGNWYVKKDSRDEDREEENKVVGKVKLYEFPSKVEQKVKKEITDRENGYGKEIFDPGKDGRNFIINVLSTKKDDKGKQWPDYSTSEFSRRQEALGTHDEIEEIMKSCVNLEEYIKSMEVDKDEMVEILKNEFLWDLVETECLDNGYKDTESGAGMREEKTTDEENSFNTEEESQEESSEESQEESSDSDDDDALLKELDSM